MFKRVISFVMKTIDRESYLNLINIIIDEYINTPENDRSLTKLSRKYGVKRQTISKYLKTRNIEVINYQNRCRINEHIFDIIDTDEKAYWLGFLYADGNISSIGNRFEMNLSINDLDHMLKFKSFLNAENEIRFGENTLNGKKFKICRFSVRNKNLWNQLCNKGCIPCKTLELKWPNESIFTNKSLIYSFIRGYFDGDGTIGLYNSKHGHIFNLSIAGTSAFLLGIQNFLGITGCIRNESTENKPSKVFTLHYSALKARKVARLLYENSSIYLDRKYNIYKKFCRVEEESSTLQSSKIGESCDANTEVSSEITKGSETP